MITKKGCSKLVSLFEGEHIIVPYMIKLICWLGVLVIASEQSCINTGGVAHTLLALGATLLVLLIWRLLSEQGVLAFNIYERLVEIRDLMARQTQAPAAIQPALRDGD